MVDVERFGERRASADPDLGRVLTARPCDQKLADRDV